MIKSQVPEFDADAFQAEATCHAAGVSGGAFSRAWGALRLYLAHAPIAHRVSFTRGVFAHADYMQMAEDEFSFTRLGGFAVAVQALQSYN